MSDKTCSRCKIPLPATSEFFSKSKKSPDGLGYRCRKCTSEHIKEWKNNHKDFREKRKEARRGYNRKRQKERPLFWRHYKKVHKWIRKNKPKLKYCSICNEFKELELANISGVYDFNIDNYLWLCKSCHRLFDRLKKTNEVVING